MSLLRQRSRPYLFSNTLAPSVAAAGIAVFDMLNSSHALRDKLQDNTDYFRHQMTAAGFDIKPGNHPIVVSWLDLIAVRSSVAAVLLMSATALQALLTYFSNTQVLAIVVNGAYCLLTCIGCLVMMLP